MKMNMMLVIVVITSMLVMPSMEIVCWQCASTDGKNCPQESKSYSSITHDACITWRLGNGTVLLQNLVMANEECTDEKVKFWSRFVDLYYKTYGGSVSCCYTDNCNDGTVSTYPMYPPSKSPVNKPSSQVVSSTLTRLPTSVPANSVGGINRPLSSQPFVGDVANLNNINGFPQQALKRAGNCEKYFEKTNADEWVPDILVPLAFDRASEAKVGVFYAKLGERAGNNDHVIVRILNKAKQNLTMYSVKLFRVGTVSIHINKLEPPRNGGAFVQQDGRKASVNAVIDLDKDRYQGFWISIKDNIEISIGRIGRKLIDSVANFTDVLREGPDEPYYFGLTTASGTSASFGVNCDMPGLHFEDTCVTDEDCEDFPETVCRSMPINTGLDPGTRSVSYDEWKEGDELLKSCWCKMGHIRIPGSKGCYDPIRKVVTLRDACFADYHCNDLPNTLCAHDLDMARYNMSCQCIPGNKPFSPDPRTGLVEGCAPLTRQDKATVAGCSRRFTIRDRAEWVPNVVFPMQHDELFQSDVGVFFVTLGPAGEGDNDEEDVAVIRLLDENKDRRKMYSIKVFRKSGKIALYESKVTRSFFFSNENDREVDMYEDLQTQRRLEADFVGFWVKYKYEDGYGGQISVGLNGAPFSPDYALVKWTDTSTSALPEVRFMGFTVGRRGSSIEFGANCVLLKTPGFSPLNQHSSYLQVPSQSQLQYPQSYYTQSLPQVVPSISGVNNPNVQQINPWDFLNSASVDPVEQQIHPSPDQTVIEPILKSQYLTKLKRLLPTYLEELQDEDISAKLQEVVSNGDV